MLLNGEPGVAVEFAAAFSFVRVFRFALFYDLIFPFRNRCLQADAGARAGARASADAKLRFGRNDAPRALHSAGALRKPIDAPQRTIGRNVFISKKELERQRENDENSGHEERRLTP